MSRVTATNNHQHESNMACHISQLLNKYSFSDVQKSIKNLTLVSLYAVYSQLSKVHQKQLLKNVPITQKIDLALLSTEPSPVIELTTAEDFLVVKNNCNVGLVKTQLLRKPLNGSNYPIVITDEFNQYLGIVEQQSLFIATETSLITELLSSTTQLHVSEAQQSAVNILANNNDHFAVLVDKQNALVGLLKLTDIIKESNSNTPPAENRPYLQTPVLSHVRQRIFWILALAAVGLLSGIIIQSYDDAITALIILAFYMPMVADTGGNAGSQAATVIIRSIALGELRLKNWLAILYKELRIAIFIGIGLACVSYLKIYFYPME